MKKLKQIGTVVVVLITLVVGAAGWAYVDIVGGQMGCSSGHYHHGHSRHHFR